MYDVQSQINEMGNDNPKWRSGSGVACGCGLEFTFDRLGVLLGQVERSVLIG